MSVVEGQFGQMWHQVAGHKDHGDSPGNFVTFCHFQSVRGGFCSDKCLMLGIRNVISLAIKQNWSLITIAFLKDRAL